MLRRVAGYDSGLVVAVLALLGVSLYLLLYDIEGGYGTRQLAFAVIGIGVAAAVSRANLEQVRRVWIGLYVGAVASIAVVFLLGSVIRGSRRWIDLGIVNLQPSETGKVLVVLGIAGLLSSRSFDVRSAAGFALVLALCAVPAGMVFVQPDFGTSLVYGYIALALLFFAGARWLHLALLGGAVVAIAVLVLALLPAVGVNVLHDFQKQRLTGFLNPEADPQGANYQAIQAKIAVGSGRLSGKPPGQASQVQDRFLPEPQTDFIFATLAERHGFVGAATVLVLYMLLISRCLGAVAVAPTIYGRLACGAFATMFAAQVFTNVGMVIGLMPITGVPLPLLSYGGSAMLANLVAIGVVAGVLRSAESPEVRYARRAGNHAARRLGRLHRETRRMRARA